MKINGLTPVYFDIETTGFSAWEDDFICGAWYSNAKEKIYVSDDLLVVLDGQSTQAIAYNMKLRKEHKEEGFDYIPDIVDSLLITWNGEGYRKGFDFPFLRSKCIQEGIEWKLAGVDHLDLLPLVRKYINTTHYVTEIPSKSSLRAGDLKKLAKVNDFGYQNKNQAY